MQGIGFLMYIAGLMAEQPAQAPPNLPQLTPAWHTQQRNKESGIERQKQHISQHVGWNLCVDQNNCASGNALGNPHDQRSKHNINRFVICMFQCPASLLPAFYNRSSPEVELRCDDGQLSQPYITGRKVNNVRLEA
jgi:hypothetical protein